jgi:enamine deaminase RidA (YjgF/YER057c/UK114 family)
MVAPAIDENQLTEALKTALVEVLEERSDLLRDVMAEIIEDVAPARAIWEGEGSEPASREEIFRILDGSK